ncbi:hypothetical protein GCM10025768_15880 [Microbacterium pseudoresistens]|uniref:Uncharacterized protein n=1 Tax=Microbacterium pseudoresistens TaxID=640634 RepID=A0A7Y9JLK9_9MICO|nr:hypothetical protein [Microbacterium pseudoresistens]NYD53061.1 hypothetical protein [Microbacterium pseudoresistens]
MYTDPMLAITYHQAEIQRAMVEAERRRVAAERGAAAKAERPLRQSSDRTPIRRLFRKTVAS